MPASSDIFVFDGRYNVRLTTNHPPGSAPPRGYDGLRPGMVVYPRRNLEREVTNDFQPMVAVNTADITKPSKQGEGVAFYDALSRSTWYLASIVQLAGDPLLNPPELIYQIRSTVAGAVQAAKVVQEGILFPGSDFPFTTSGMVAQVTGALGTQFEFWLKFNEAHGSPTVGTILGIRLITVVDRTPGPFGVVEGSLATAP